ncbi:CRISPR-associated protein Cas5 [Halomicroarcula sp. GCM10025709]
MTGSSSRSPTVATRVRSRSQVASSRRLPTVSAAIGALSVPTRM